MTAVDNYQPESSRFLVVGSGIAGLQFALQAAAAGSVQLVTKKESRESNTNYAQGGIAAVVSPLDDFDSHIRDTLEAGAGLCREDVVRQMVEAGPELVERLISYGVHFSRESGGGAGFSLGREGGHSHRRVLHCKDLTGREIEASLLAACRADPRITIEENHIGIDLLLGREAGLTGAGARRVIGCVVQDRLHGSRRVYVADAVVLATGGSGKVYSYTSNPDIATGDGLAMAFRAGAELRNLEFVQFHPTCLYHPDAKSFLISEAVRGEGAVLINRRGKRFMEGFHPLADLAPRDVVARGIDREMKVSGEPCVFLDLRHLERAHVEERFPNLVQVCRGFGIDMAGEPVPVVPAAHYMCGGVAVDLDSRSSLPGLYAIGEVSCTGIHGANRLASNSLLEAVFFASRAASAAACEPPLPAEVCGRVGETLQTGRPTAAQLEAMVLEHDWDLVRRIMWDYVGVVRDNARLEIALARLRGIRTTVESLYMRAPRSPEVVELRNLALVGEMIVLCARSRHESRGLHYTLDYPELSASAEDSILRAGQPLAGETCFDPGAGAGS